MGQVTVMDGCAHTNRSTQARYTATHAGGSALYLVNCRSLRHSILSIGLFRNGWLWLGIAGVLLLQAAITYLPFLNSIFQTAPIGWDEWLRILAAGLVVLGVVETHKWLFSETKQRT